MIPTLTSRPSAGTKALKSDGTTLLHLPDELLSQIFLDLEKDDLYNLALLCGRLHLIALTAYFSREGIHIGNPSSVELKLSSGSTQMLKALSICLFFTSVRHLSFEFKSSGSFAFMGLSNKVKNLKNFLSRLTGVEEVTLDFKGVSPAVNHKDTLSEKDIDAVRGLLKTIIKKGCKKLMVLDDIDILPKASEPKVSQGHGRSISQANPSRSNQHGGNPRSRRLSAIFGTRPPVAQNLPITVTQTTRPVKPDKKHRSALTTVVLAPMMLVPSLLCDYTVLTLNSSRITTLSFDHQKVPPHIWSTFLPQLSIPTLSELIIPGCSVEWSDLSDFLSRHRTLASLSITVTSESKPPLPRSLMIGLPNLTTLSCTPVYLDLFLGSPNRLPKLQHVTLILHTPVAWHFKQTCPHTMILRQLANITVTVRIIITSTVLSCMDPIFGEHAPSSMADLLGHATNLQFETRFIRGWLWLGNGPTLLPLTFQSKLPMLKYISFDKALSWMTHQDKIAFARKLVRACPSLETIVIYDKEYRGTDFAVKV